MVAPAAGSFSVTSRSKLYLRSILIRTLFHLRHLTLCTRPLGASFADWMSKRQSIGGLGWGDGHVAFALTIIIIVFVGYLAHSHSDVKDRQS